MKKIAFFVSVIALMIIPLLIGQLDFSNILGNNEKENNSLNNNQDLSNQNSNNQNNNSNPKDDENEFEITENNFSVSSATKEATEVAAEILRNGGNAIDASIALSFALGVSLQQNGSIGSGGVMLVYDPFKDSSYYYDYYSSSGYEVSNYNIGIPGFLNGMEIVFNDYATMAIDQLIQPSIDLARNGVIINPEIADLLTRSQYVAEINRNFLIDGRVVSAGETITQEDIALTYETIIEKGFNVLYDGESDLSLNLMRVTGLSKESLRDYQAYKRDALTTDYSGYQVFATNAPFYGLVSLETLKLYDQLGDIDFYVMDNYSFEMYQMIYDKAFTDGVRKVADSDKLRDEATSLLDNIKLS